MLNLNGYFSKVKEEIFSSFKEKYGSLEFDLDQLKIEKAPEKEDAEFGIPCFPLGRVLKKSPVQVATEIAEAFEASDLIEKLQAVGPYLNVYINRQAFMACVCASVRQDKNRFGSSFMGKGKRVMVEYSSPNTNKPLHIGHVRNNLVGMTISRILEFNGYEVIKVNLINDRGIHICKSMLAYEKWGEGETPESSGKKGDHLVGEYYVRFDRELKKEKEEYATKVGFDQGTLDKEFIRKKREDMRQCSDKEEKKKLRQEISDLAKKGEAFEQEFLANSQYTEEAQGMLQKWEQGDEDVRSLWKKMNDWVLAGFEDTYAILGCEFEKLYFESDTYTLGRKFVEEGLGKGLFERYKDGSIWVKAEKLKEAAPKSFKKVQLNDKLLLRKDGTSVYMTQDIGTAALKNEDYTLDRSLYVVAEEQNLHFKILFAVLEMLGFPWACGCEHVPYGMVILPRGMGKIKSREGTAVDADDLIQEMKGRAEEKIRDGEVRVSEEQIEDTSLKVALSALKLFMLQVSLDKTVQFDPHEVIEFYGDTGPAILYSYARIQGIFRKAEILPDEEKSIDVSLLTTSEEFALLQMVSEFPDTVKTACNYNPHLLVSYLLTLKKNFSSYYGKEKVINEDNQALTLARLGLCQVVAQTIQNGLSLLGIEVVDNM